MAKIQTTLSIDADIKPLAQQTLAELGLDLSTAVNMFLRQVVREEAIPFIVGKKPNAATLEAMREIEEIESNLENEKRYSSFSELRREVEENA